MELTSLGTRLTGLGDLRPGSAAAKGSGTGFSEALHAAGAAIVDNQDAAARAVESFTSGAQGNLHETLLATDKAEISLKLLVTVRNKLIDTYREVMRMGA